MDYRGEIIAKVEEGLAGRMSTDMIHVVGDEFMKALNGYEVIKSETSLVPYEGVNEAVLKRFCACLMIEGRSEKTIAQYRRTAQKLFQCAQKNYTEMGVYDIRLFLAFQKEAGVSNRTLENQRANLSAFFQWMLQEDLIVKNPCMSIQPIKYTDKVRLPLSSVEIDSLRSSCRTEKERAIVELLLSSGVRVSELTALRVCDIDFDKLSVHVTKGKGDKERTAYMSELAKKHLQMYLASRKGEGDYPFYNIKGEQLCAGGVRHILVELGKRAGVENVHPHRFRRTFATGMANRGMEIQEIKKLLGHSNINTTLEYVYTSDEKAHASYLKYSV